jgi:hypothetical protein
VCDKLRRTFIGEDRGFRINAGSRGAELFFANRPLCCGSTRLHRTPFDTSAEQTMATRQRTPKGRPAPSSPPVLNDVVSDGRDTSSGDSFPEVKLSHEPVRLADREQRIAVRAHQLAQARGFAPGGELEDWLQAEREVDAQASGAGDGFGSH